MQMKSVCFTDWSLAGSRFISLTRSSVSLVKLRRACCLSSVLPVKMHRLILDTHDPTGITYIISCMRNQRPMIVCRKALRPASNRWDQAQSLRATPFLRRYGKDDGECVDMPWTGQN